MDKYKSEEHTFNAIQWIPEKGKKPPVATEHLRKAGWSAKYWKIFTYDGWQRLEGYDWILSDALGNMFIRKPGEFASLYKYAPRVAKEATGQPEVPKEPFNEALDRIIAKYFPNKRCHYFERINDKYVQLHFTDGTKGDITGKEATDIIRAKDGG